MGGTFRPRMPFFLFGTIVLVVFVWRQRRRGTTHSGRPCAPSVQRAVRLYSPHGCIPASSHPLCFPHISPEAGFPSPISARIIVAKQKPQRVGQVLTKEGVSMSTSKPESVSVAAMTPARGLAAACVLVLAAVFSLTGCAATAHEDDAGSGAVPVPVSVAAEGWNADADTPAVLNIVSAAEEGEGEEASGAANGAEDADAAHSSEGGSEAAEASGKVQAASDSEVNEYILLEPNSEEPYSIELPEGTYEVTIVYPMKKDTGQAYTAADAAPITFTVSQDAEEAPALDLTLDSKRFLTKAEIEECVRSVKKSDFWGLEEYEEVLNAILAVYDKALASGGAAEEELNAQVYAAAAEAQQVAAGAGAATGHVHNWEYILNDRSWYEPPYYVDVYGSACDTCGEVISSMDEHMQANPGHNSFSRVVVGQQLHDGINHINVESYNRCTICGAIEPVPLG